jgi:hypothetical protein
MIRRIVPLVAIFSLAALLISCAGKPAAQTRPEEPAATAPAVPEPAPAPAPQPALAQPTPQPAPRPFDPTAVSAEVKTAAITDIRALIANLNTIIQRQDYDSWRANLTDAYVAQYSDPVLLAQYSEYPVLKRQNVTLKTLKDYFVYLVYPSHQNDRVDDIEFVDENLVKAITVSPKGSRDILYILEKHGDTWKIGIGR